MVPPPRPLFHHGRDTGVVSPPQSAESLPSSVSPSSKRRSFQFWYLIDPFPFENIHNPLLHHGTVNVLRSALVSAVLSQCLLGIQDMKVLPPGVVTSAAFVTRFVVVVPAYVAMVAFIHVLSRRFASQSTSHAPPQPSFDAFAHRRDENLKLKQISQGYVPAAQASSSASASPRWRA
ncbi:hypothetical protein H310_14997 [Aphanomyces invadans]|uniref:Uncharacterized protein n=1 Tax=Aphanomyces invadans TaxID=157072 RepID=A0A024T962_9STRA|nr:hypothetical protein H310_14997 [Aphanomyces invadans]ETV90166.1 hypothetical protein H310_14997 [Aphanomyces invadans]|eukprot:XP_008881196.1 hypothetical protein H310_14997 [Aphanomyces invadans]